MPFSPSTRSGAARGQGRSKALGSDVRGWVPMGTRSPLLVPIAGKCHLHISSPQSILPRTFLRETQQGSLLSGLRIMPQFPCSIPSSRRCSLLSLLSTQETHWHFFFPWSLPVWGEKGAKVSGDKAGVEISTFATPPPIPSIHAQSSRALKALCPARGQNPLPRPIHASLLPAERNLPPGTQYPPSVGESEWERAVPSPRRPRGAKCRCGNGVARSRVRCCATLRVLMAFQPQRSAVI